MELTFTQKKSIRKNFGKLQETLSIPNLIEVQKKSFSSFVEKSLEKKKSIYSKGLTRVFESVFPINDASDKSSLEFIGYSLSKPKFDVTECRQRSLTYSAALKANLRLVVYDINSETNTKQILSAKEQEVFVGDLPLMTPSGTFVVNGVERVVVNQMHRSPGVFFDHDKGKTHASGKLLFNCRIIPGRGSWLDFEFDPKDILYFRIDRKKKLPISTLLYALGKTREEILDTFYTYDNYTYDPSNKSWSTTFKPEKYKRPVKLMFDLIDKKNNKKVLKKGEKLNFVVAEKLKNKDLKEIFVSPDEIIGKYTGGDIKDKSGEVILRSGFNITKESLDKIISSEVYKLNLANVDTILRGPYIFETVKQDKNNDKKEALFDIYKVLRPGEPPSTEIAEEIFKNLYFNNERYDLSDVGRVKLNAKLDLKHLKQLGSSSNDIIAIIKFMLDLRDGKGDVDDIDHLGNKE